VTARVPFGATGDPETVNQDGTVRATLVAVGVPLSDEYAIVGSIAVVKEQ
jgi:hypothetical protein